VMTNSERVVTLCSQFREPLGQAKADWEIFAEVGRRLGYVKEFAFANSAAVYNEFVRLTKDRPCDMSGLTHGRLRQQGPIQWPCPLEEPETFNSLPLQCTTQGNLTDEKPESGIFSALLGSNKIESPQAKRLYTNGTFNTADGRAKFAALHSKGLAEPIDREYPLVLTIGRLYEHWHTLTRTGRIDKIMKRQPNPFLEIHPKDAQVLGIEETQMVEIRSRRGLGRFPARITKAIAPGTVFIPMHWGALWGENTEANALTHPEACPDSLQPELKACAVKLVPLALKPATYVNEPEFNKESNQKEFTLQEPKQTQPKAIEV
jgi:ferredoxin-nitrate reductase